MKMLGVAQQSAEWVALAVQPHVNNLVASPREETMRDYNSLYKFFEGLSHDIRHDYIAVQGRVVMKLLPRIKGDKAFDDLILGTAHAGLFMGYDGGKRVIQVWGENENIYRISIFNGETMQSSDIVMIEDKDVIRVLEEYVGKLDPSDKF